MTRLAHIVITDTSSVVGTLSANEFNKETPELATLGLLGVVVAGLDLLQRRRQAWISSPVTGNQPAAPTEFLSG